MYFSDTDFNRVDSVELGMIGVGLERVIRFIVAGPIQNWQH